MPPRSNPGLGSNNPSIGRYLLDRERVVVEVRHHWGVLVGPIAVAFASFVVVLYADSHVRVDGGPVARALWLAWLAVLGWTLWKFLEWRTDRFIATDKRLLLTYGILTKRIAMMPFIKVTDMSYRRSVPGRIFGYGQFILESAGQDQALRKVDWVPHPDRTYRIICAEIFGVPQRDQLVEEADAAPNEAGPIKETTGRWQIRNPFSRSSRPSYSRAIPLHEHRRPSQGQPPRELAPVREAESLPSGEMLYSSDDERLRRRMAETGPIPYDPQAED